MHEFKLHEMTCGNCEGVVGQTLNLADPACKFQVDMPARKVTVQSDEDRAVLAEALTDAGYPPA